MKKKGYISVLALIVSVLVFSVITAILISIDYDTITNKNEKYYYQNCLISESIANKVKYDKQTKDSLYSIFEKMGLEIKYYDIYYDEIISGGKTRLRIEKFKDKSIRINYDIKYNKTNTSSTIVLLRREEIEEKELEDNKEDSELNIIDENELAEDNNIENGDEEVEEIEDKKEQTIKIIYEFSKYWIN